MTGLYRPGGSPLHLAAPGVKLLALAVVTGAVLVVRSPVAVGAGLVVVAVGYVVAGVPPRVALAQVLPLRWVLLVVAAAQLWLVGWRAAVVLVGALVVCLSAAALVTLTTRVGDLLDAVVRAAGPSRRLGVDPERVGLVLALAVRAVPVLVETARQVQEARRARGLERSARALVTPLVVRSVRQAHLLGEALVARGVDDDPAPPPTPRDHAAPRDLGRA